MHGRLEHAKPLQQKVDDIYDYTEDKVSDVIQRVVRTYNKKFASRDPQTLKQIDKLFDQEICLPIGYEDTSVIEELEREFREQIRLETLAASAVHQIEPVLLN